jgi:anaerobic nitric oxide reductase transcription regulator
MTALAAAALRVGELVDTLERQAEHQGLVARDLVADVMTRRGTKLIGRGPATAKLQDEIDLVAPADLPVLVTGETGVGKELVVRMLHARSRRAKQPLVYVNCAALPEGVVESELFGHVKGAFTGAAGERMGKFRVADGATLFLDEIGELPLHVQPKLLRALQEGEVQCVGSDRVEHVDVRVLAATNRDLEAEVAAGRFRADLLHRLDVGRIHVPALREHREDVPDLVGHYADRAQRRLGCGPIRFTPAAHEVLASGAWPGNVRELENVISRGVLRASGRVQPGQPVEVDAPDVEGSVTSAAPVSASPAEEAAPGVPLRDALQAYQVRLIREAVDRHDGNWAAAARDLGLDRGNLHHMAKRLGLK